MRFPISRHVDTLVFSGLAGISEARRSSETTHSLSLAPAMRVVDRADGLAKLLRCLPSASPDPLCRGVRNSRRGRKARRGGSKTCHREKARLRMSSTPRRIRLRHCRAASAIGGHISRQTGSPASNWFLGSDRLMHRLTGRPIRPGAWPTDRTTDRPPCQAKPTDGPSDRPFVRPTDTRPSGCLPTAHPTGRPDDRPSDWLTDVPTVRPSVRPTFRPSVRPSIWPAGWPTDLRADSPAVRPTADRPTIRPIDLPAVRPSGRHFDRPFERALGRPTDGPFDLATASPPDVRIARLQLASAQQGSRPPASIPGAEAVGVGPGGDGAGAARGPAAEDVRWSRRSRGVGDPEATPEQSNIDPRARDQISPGMTRSSPDGPQIVLRSTLEHSQLLSSGRPQTDLRWTSDRPELGSKCASGRPPIRSQFDPGFFTKSTPDRPGTDSMSTPTRPQTDLEFARAS